jgi:hypothetical protein
MAYVDQNMRMKVISLFPFTQNEFSYEKNKEPFTQV